MFAALWDSAVWEDPRRLEEKEVGGRKTRSGECSLWALKLLAQTSWCWVQESVSNSHTAMHC